MKLAGRISHMMNTTDTDFACDENYQSHDGRLAFLPSGLLTRSVCSLSQHL